MLKTNETGNAVAGGKASKLLLRALAGETLLTPPVWLMRQAGRYLPEYRKLRAEAGSFLDLCYNPEFATEVTLQPIRRFGFDAAILFADILLVPHALGQSLSFVEGEGPSLPPLKGLQDIKALDRGRMHDRLAPVYETVRRLSKELPEEVTLIGFAGAPWTVATYMVEGGGSRDHAATKRWAFTEPDSFQKLIDLLVVSTSDYLIAQVEAGAEVVQLFDTWAGALPESGFRRWCVEPASRIVARLNDACPGVPVIGFPRGVGAGAAIFANETGVAGLGLDWTQPLDWVAETLQTKLTVQGNLDPMLLAAGGEAMADDVKRILATLGKGPFIFNLGHGILPHTPPEHVSELMAIVRGGA